MTAKEIADLARKTNLIDDDARNALDDAIRDRANVRHKTGETCASEDALRAALGATCEAARNYLRTLDNVAERSAKIATSIRTDGIFTRSMFETGDAVIGTTAHVGETYNAAVRAWHSAIDLFEAVADLVRATPQEKTDALARLAAHAAEVAPKPSRRKRVVARFR